MSYGMARTPVGLGLLRHPGGFEGFFPMFVLVYAQNLAVAQRVDLEIASIDLDPAFSAAPLVMRDHDDLIEQFHDSTNIYHDLFVVPVTICR